MMRFWITIFLLTFWLPSNALELPDMGTSADTVMSPAEEQKLGETFIRKLRTQVEVIDDLEINHYLNALGQRLASYAQTSETFHFFVVKEPSINAFAVPGGFIGLHSGLILHTQEESELASVIAHEIAHVSQRHIARMIEASRKFSLPAMAAMIAAIIVGATTDNPDIGQAAVAAATAGNIQMQINFTREHEQESDRLGMQILAEADFDPRSMPTFFERMQASTRYYDGELPEFLRTHPVTSNRIAEARSRAEKYSKRLLQDAPLYHLMRAKLSVLLEDNLGKLTMELQKMLEEGRYRDQRAVRYALALALLNLEKPENVQNHIDWLRQRDTDRVVYRLLQARLTLQQQGFAKAISVYEQALKAYPGDQLLSLEYGEKLLQQRQPAKAKEILLQMQTSVATPQYYHLLAQVYQATGNKAEAHLALAEHFYLLGQTPLAVEQLEEAKRIKNLDFYLSARVEARHKELQQELKEEQEM